MTKQVKADLMIIVVALFWSFSYFLIDISLEELGPFALNAYRFIGAFLAAMALAYKSLSKVSKDTIKYSAGIGLVLSAVYIFASYGVKYTSVSNAGFLCAMPVVFTPIIAFFVKGIRPEKKLIFVVFLSTVSIALLTFNEQLKPALGDILCLLCALSGSVHLLLVETAVRKESVNAFHLGVYQLAFVGIFNLILSLFFDTSFVPQSPDIWKAVIFLSVFCTGVVFVLLTMAQKHTSASHVGVLLTLEPVLAGFVAFYFAGEILLPRAYAGAVMLILGILILEIDLKKLFRLG